MVAAKDSDPSLGFLTKKETEARLPRPTKVKNKTPTPRQITSEQILREARREAEIRPPKRKIADSTELVEYRLRKRKEFEDQKERIEDAIVERRRFQYEEEVRKNPLSYDLWLDYIRLEESGRNNERIREVYERAIANVPLAEEKRYWQRYIYSWINYALFEELEAEDVERTRNVYRECLKLIPHEKFSFAKIWLMAAQFEIRQLNLKGARLILGKAIGKASKDKIFQKYIELELQLGNIDCCRKLYEKYLEWSPENCYAWSKYAEMEKSLSETERARAIFELAIAQPALDMPELLWKAYIDFEISEGEFEKTRELYERLDDTGSDYLFPEETQNTNFKILEAAYRWKKQKTSR